MPRVHTDTIDGTVYNIAYRVVTTDLRALGLNKNPNILEYPFNEWYFLPPKKLEEGPGDWGGIWLARIPSNARKLQKYMRVNRDTETRIFKAAIDQILFINDYRLKTNGMMLYEEM